MSVQNLELNSSKAISVEATVFSELRAVYEVAGLSFAMRSGPDLPIKLYPELEIFAVGLKDRCDVEVSVEWADRIEVPQVQPTFASGGLWTAYRRSDGMELYFQTDNAGPEPYKYCWFDQDVTRAHVRLLRRYFEPGVPIYPLEYPLDELLMINRLGRGDGAEIHSCGVVTPDGLGRLFVGHSGAGKSTASRLWMKLPGVQVLSDDRIILRPGRPRPTMHGTPWHGDAGLAEQACVPLHKIYLLEQAQTNEIIPLAPARAAAELFARTFVPHHVGSALASTLRFLEEVTQAVPVAILRCTADQRAIDEVLRAG